MDEIVRIHASSGTTGKPTVVAYTRGDLDVWTEVMARTLRAGGVHQGDVVQNAYGYGLFTGGLGFHYGAEAVGAAVIPTSGGFTDRQLLALHDLASTVLCCTPSYALHLAEAIDEAGLRPADLRLRVGFFGAEPWTEAMRETIQSRLRLMALNVYGLSEVTGPGVAVECPERRGMHVAEDHFLPEVIDPTTLEPVPPGTIGELVFTTLTKQGMPLIRYRTRDLTGLDPEPCPCGRTLVRLARIMGRSDDMLIIRGVNVYPSQVEHALLQVPELAPHYLLVVRREHTLDTLEVQVEGQPAAMAAGKAPSPRSPRGCDAGSSRRSACRPTSASWRRRRSSAAPARPSACWTSGRGAAARGRRPCSRARRPCGHDLAGAPGQARRAASIAAATRSIARVAASGRAAAKPSTSAGAARAGRA